MATNTTIEWADKTWSPIIGCDRVSPGCDHCYAISTARIREGNPNPKISAAFAETTKRTEGGIDWSGKVNLLTDRLDAPLRWKKPRRVFVNSMSDLFHDAVPEEFIVAVFARMWWSPQHTFQVLTKRHGRMRSLMPRIEERLREMERDLELVHVPAPLTWPLPNVWLGVSVENQRWADIRVPALLDTPAAVRFLSCEPLLGPIDLWGPIVPGRGRPKLTYWLDGRPGWGPEQTDDRGRVFQELAVGPRINWVICGGESGPRARPAHPDWFRTLRDQCAHSGVPFFLKQLGEWGPAPFRIPVCDPAIGWQGTEEELAAAKADSEARGATHVHTGNWYEQDGERRYEVHEIGHKPWSLERVGLPEGVEPIRRWGKKRAGRELDGRVHDDFPRVGGEER